MITALVIDCDGFMFIVCVRVPSQAIFRSRKIFQRMRNYCIYRVACTFQLLVFFFFAILTIDPHSSHFYGTNYGPPAEACVLPHGASFTLPVIALIVITILNDGTIITIAYDRVQPEKTPQQWNLTEVCVCVCDCAVVCCGVVAYCDV